jgi:hypothetical protein
MAFFFDGDYPMKPSLQFGGHVFSLYGTSNRVKSCKTILARSASAKSTREIAISTGKKHATFYTPTAQWIEPLRKWLASLTKK